MPVEGLGVKVHLIEDDRTTILLGWVLGSAELPDGQKMEVCGSGNTLEFRVGEYAWRTDIRPLADAAYKLYLAK